MRARLIILAVLIAAQTTARADPTWEPLVTSAEGGWTTAYASPDPDHQWTTEYIAPDWDTSLAPEKPDTPWQTAVLTVPPAPATSPQARVNTTGHPISLPLPLQEATFQLGEISAVIQTDDTVTLAPTELAALLKDRLPPEKLNRLRSTQDPRLDLSSLNAIGGFTIRLDQAAMLLTLSLDASSAATREIAFATARPAIPTQQPAPISGFLNYAVTLDQDWGSDLNATALALDLTGATYVLGIVLEAEASLTGPYQTFLCPFEALCRDVNNTGFRRRGTRAVYDHEDLDLRTIAGDTSYRGLSSQRSTDILGLSLQHDSALFGRPNSQATHGISRTLFLDRPATVQVRLNGLPLRTLTLPSGTYDLSNIPVTLGANTLEIDVAYDDGTHQHLSFDSFANQQLLSPGAAQWSLAGGLPAVWQDGARAYTDGVAAGAFLRYGLTDTITVTATAQTDDIVHNLGIGADTLTPFGLLGFTATASQYSAPGVALDATLQSLSDLAAAGTTYRLSAIYYSPDFRFPGDRQLAETDVLYPAFDTWLNLSATASQRLSNDLTAIFSARYAFADDTASTPGAVSQGVDRWNLDAGLSHDFQGSTVTLTAGYGNDRLFAFGVGLDDEPEFRVSLNVLARLGETTTVSASHSFGNDVSQLSGVTSAKDGTALWRASAYAENSPERGRALTAAATVTTSYGEAQIAQTLRQPGTGDDIQRTQARLSGALAFAGQSIAAGPPIRGGFAIVRPHKSIDGSEVIVGNTDDPRATGSSWHPALITDLPAYTNTQYALDATDTPLGYSIGTGVLSVRSPYRAGYAVEVGSDAALSVIGTLIDRDGKPVTMQAASATSPEHPGVSLPIFTNGAGRFGGEGFAPGTWTIALAIDPAQQFEFTIPETTAGLHDAATLHPRPTDTP